MGSVVSTSKAREARTLAALVRDMGGSSNKRSRKLAIFSGVEILGASVEKIAARERGGGPLARKGMCKERLLQIVSVATQVAICKRQGESRLSARKKNGFQH